VLWAITKGSFKNKLIILPIAFVLSATAPWLIPIILIFGGLYLAFEGAEVIYHFLESNFFKPTSHKKKKDLTEEQKIKSAVLTDFVLSIEIIMVALGSVIEEPLIVQIIAVSFVAIVATVGVYGVVAVLVRMDDVGYFLINRSKEESLKRKFGQLLIVSLPKIIKILSFVGLIAMLLVSGGLLTHNITFLHHVYNEYFEYLPVLLYELILAIIIGMSVFAIEHILMHKILDREEKR
jgi:predicted DNA repair protein MutK